MEEVLKIKNSKKKQKRICPFCEGANVVGNGIYKDRKRYKCKDCKKSFNDLTGTVFSHIQDKDKFNLYAKKVMLGKSIRQSAKELEISPNTSFLWRKRIMSSFVSQKELKNNK